MFVSKAKAAVKCLGADGDLIYNENADLKIKMLTLVKVKAKTLWPVVKYKISNLTLLDLLQEPDFTPDIKKEVAIKDFHNLKGICIRGRAAAEGDASKVGLKVSAALDTVDAASPINLEKKMVDINKLRKSCANKKIKEEIVNMLKIKEKEKLAFVDKMFYNTAPVKFHGKTGKASRVSGMFVKMGCSLQGKKKSEINFTIPEDTTFAYSLMEITMDNKTLGIPIRFINMERYNKGWWRISSDADNETLQQLMEEIFKKAALLQPLAELHESRRCDLLKTLRELLDDGDALSLLEETLGQSGKKRPQSPAVSSFMDLLDASGESPDPKDAAHLLVSAMDTLPDDAAVLLAKCNPETLRVLQQLVNNLKEGAQAKLPESLPDSLQEEGELRWAAELLCLNDQMLTELRAQWDTPEFPPEVMLELVCLVVQGLSLMQP